MTLLHNLKFRLFLFTASTWALMSMTLEGVPFSFMSFAGHTLAASYALLPLIAIGYGLYRGTRLLQSMFDQQPSAQPSRPTCEPIIEEPKYTPLVAPTPSPQTELTATSSITPKIEEIEDDEPVVSRPSEPDSPFAPLISDMESDTSPIKTKTTQPGYLSKEVDSTPDTPPLGSDSEGQEFDYPDFGGGFDEDDFFRSSSEERPNTSDDNHHAECTLNAPSQSKATASGQRVTACPAPTIPTQLLVPVVGITDTQPTSTAASEAGHPTRQRQRYFLPFRESIAYRVKNFPRDRFFPDYYVPENFKKTR